MGANKAENTVLLFHGTTQSRCESIQRDGWKPISISSEIERVSRVTNRSAREIELNLREQKAFAYLDRGRDGRTVSLTTGLKHGVSYASRAPEIEWEALWAAFRLENPEIGNYWNQSVEGHWWVLKHQLSDRPMIITVAVPYAEVLRREPRAADDYLDFEFQVNDDDGIEIKLEPDCDIEIVSINPSDRQVDASLLSYLVGVSEEEIRLQVEAGEWGDPFCYRMGRFWDWNEVYQRLPQSRRSELGLPNRECWWE